MTNPIIELGGEPPIDLVRTIAEKYGEEFLSEKDKRRYHYMNPKAELSRMINTKGELLKFVSELGVMVKDHGLGGGNQLDIMFDMLKEVVQQTPLPDIDKIYEVVKKRYK